MRRLVLAALLAITAALAAASPAAAGIWAPIASGTTQDISAIDSRTPGDNVYATTAGRIYRNGAQQLDAVGVQFTDVELNPAGTRGLASAANGVLYHYDGSAWTQVALPATYNHTCPGSPGSPAYTKSFVPTANLVAVSYASDTVAYIASADRGVVLRYTEGGSPAIAEISRQLDGTCRADTGSGTSFTDVQAVTPQLVYLVTSDFGTRRITTDGFATNAAVRNVSAVNCFNNASRIAIDLDSPNRSFMVGGPSNCNGSLSFGYSTNSGTDYELGPNFPNGNSSDLTGLSDIAVSGGAAVAVGNGGAILVSLDGQNAYFQPADGEPTTNWLSVDKTSATNAVIGGPAGKLYASAQANAIPDLVPPAGTITGPLSVVAGRPATFTANVADNAGGSGINPASLAWSATGVPPATGNPVTLTFPSAGFYTVTVAFRDNAGNAGTARLSVTVGAPVVTPAPVVSKTKTTTVTVAGGKVTLGAPRACVPANTTFTATLSFKKATKKGSLFVKVSSVIFYVDGKKQGSTDKRAPFSKKLSVKKLKAGTKHTLKARATIKVKRGKSPKKSISTSFSVCR